MTHKPDIRAPWIETGYEVFAYDGPQGLKVERLAKMVGKNKSSFYHLFADMDVFTTLLLDLHLKQARKLARKEADCRQQEELIRVLTDHKTDLLFNRQLRVNRDIKVFETCFTTTTEFSIPAIMPVWKQIIGLEEHSYLAELVLGLSLENFFLQITDKTLTAAWIEEYFDHIRALISHFQKANYISSPDGTV